VAQELQRGRSMRRVTSGIRLWPPASKRACAPCSASNLAASNTLLALT
jgi:hypothetical protein